MSLQRRRTIVADNDTPTYESPRNPNMLRRRPQGAAYYAPETFSDRVWNLYFISVTPGRQGGGIGGALLNHVDNELRQRGPSNAQVLIVETSSTNQYTRTRKFYPKYGFVEEARIRRFYGPNDHKVVFWKSLTTDR